MKTRFGETLAGVLQGTPIRRNGSTSSARSFATAPEEYRAGFAEKLFNALLGQPWTQPLRGRGLRTAGATLRRERAGAVAAGRAVAGLYRLTDRMVQARFQAAMGKVEHQEKLTRSELRASRKRTCGWPARA